MLVYKRGEGWVHEFITNPAPDKFEIVDERAHFEGEPKCYYQCLHTDYGGSDWSNVYAFEPAWSLDRAIRFATRDNNDTFRKEGWRYRVLVTNADI